MTEIERAVSDALAKLGAQHNVNATPRHGDTSDDDDAQPARRIVTRRPPKTRAIPVGATNWDAISARCGSDVGKYADLVWGGATLRVRIGAISGMTGKATVQVCETRQVLDVQANELINRGNVE